MQSEQSTTIRFGGIRGILTPVPRAKSTPSRGAAERRAKGGEKGWGNKRRGDKPAVKQ